MFKKSIEAIIADGLKELKRLSESAFEKAVEANEIVDRCQHEIQALVTLAQQVPEKVFDRYGHVLVTTIETNGAPAGYYGSIQLGACSGSLRGLMGEETVKPGKYRVIVLLEPIS